MESFIIRFLICNLFITVILGILLAIKKLFKNTFSSRMQYNLWFLFVALLAVPFLPVRPIGFLQFFSWFGKLQTAASTNTDILGETTTILNPSDGANWMNDFSLSVSQKTPSVLCLILYVIWTIGIFVMILFMFTSFARLKTLTRSALPLQNPDIQKLYVDCLKELNIHKEISIRSTAFLKSPMITGVFKPTIYLPIHLIFDCALHDIRYMLLHELQHFKHKDNLMNYIMNLINIVYWFNPFVWYALRDMRNDREAACDLSVLLILEEDEYTDYGNTLIDLAEKISLPSFPFATGIGGNMKQMKRRIMNIATYKKPSASKRLKGIIAFMLTAVFLLNLSPALSTYAVNEDLYQWNASSENISYMDFSAYFGEYSGSFILYDLENDRWKIYNPELATLRVSPNSTYKIYNALFGLESGVITPDKSQMVWKGEIYPFEDWNKNQDLNSAMANSVNWYFQNIDQALGAATLEKYIKEIGYGNENTDGAFPSYWLESSLKISPIEQVELLTNFYNNRFDFNPDNIDAVKDSIFLSSSSTGCLYGKTGTGRVDDQDINGWFIGYVETTDHTCFFATNIQANENASGSNASQITLSILSDLNILN